MFDATVFKCLLAAAGLLIVGLFAWRRSKRRVGDTPHCRRCEYIVTEAAAGRCPECGTELSPANVVHGEPRRRRSWVAGAVVCFSLSAALIWLGGTRALRNYDWYHLRPTGLVLKDFRSSDPTLANRAWTELRRRWDAGSLSASRREEFLLACTDAEQADSASWASDERVDFVAEQVAARRAGKAVERRFFDRAIRVSFVARPRVGPKDNLQVVATFHAAALARGGNARMVPWWATVREGPLLVDGKQVRELGGSMSSSGSFFNLGSTATFGPPVSPGHHTLTWSLTWDEGVGQKTGYEGGTPIARREFAGQMQVHCAPGFSMIKHDASAVTTTRVRDCLEAQDFNTYRHPDRVQRSNNLRISSAPANVAAKIFAVIGGKEYEVGTLVARAGQDESAYCELPNDVPADVAAVDLIVRSSDDVARSTVDLYDTWAGEIVLHGVPITKPQP